ncbi:hypothetical protein B0T24DRAFT_202021 [Lasiosphaeria ovina]|uniref:Zn(2)-C6 fungal-type domain-containing protein n=1 Tax=Lasiosphaeria ovina TaxID=92902 RepID=A0AAE0N9A0_9PEZI|nr:hypothetical protein B0T24DRAFT_202021 [Lasiosphaeria ovina]
MSEQMKRAAEAEARRRKVRKGTHSCWECRRRKIRCQFGPGNDVVCLPCQGRGSSCRSQEFVDESRPQQQPDRRMAQRLGRLEDLMSKLVDRILPESISSSRSRDVSPASSDDTVADGTSARYQQALDVLEASVVTGAETPVGLLLGLRKEDNNTSREPQPQSLPTPESDHSAPRKGSVPRHEKICRVLYALFPSEHDITLVAETSAAPYFLTSLFTPFRNLLEGRFEHTNNMNNLPALTNHPTVLAKRLLQIAIFIQQMPTSFDVRRLQTKRSLPDLTSDIISTVSQLVTSNDELVGTAEGLQCIILQGVWHANAGNLRKAWLSYRRAMSLGQLMGIDQGSSLALKFVDPTVSPDRRTTPQALWYRINFFDRSTSLLLGLPAGSRDDSFATEEAMRRDTDMERLEKLQTVIGGRLIERNANKSSQHFAMTLSIHRDLEEAARSMDLEWWAEPEIDPSQGNESNLGTMFHMMLQVHHFDLMILLHLPFMLQSSPEVPDDNQSKAACVRASREVLKRFVSFRRLYSSPWACRHIDYSALVAAMTLLLSYLRQHQAISEPFPTCAERADDRRLVEVVRERMLHVALVNHDKLSKESAEILSRMMPILDSIDESMIGFQAEGTVNALKFLNLNIPYLGTVNIQTNNPNLAGRSSFATLDPDPPQGNGNSSGPGFHDASDTHQLQLSMESMSGIGDAAPSSDAFHLNAGSMDSETPPPDTTANGMFMQFDPQPQDTNMLEFPLTAEADDWVLQGIDTTYWSLVNADNISWGS